MHPITFIVPGSLHAPTGGSVYDRRMVEGLRERGWSVDVQEVQTAAEGSVALASVGAETIAVVDGLLFSEMADSAVREASRLRLVALVHLPRALEPGLSAASRGALEAVERRALARAALVVATGESTVLTLLEYGVEHERIALVQPGADRARLAVGSASTTVELLCVATINPGKGHDILLRALAANRSQDWRLTCVGSLERSPGTVERLRAALRLTGLEDRVQLTGELDASALEECYQRADAFLLATLRETYGMAVAEAIAHGVPVLSTKTGAISSLVGVDAGLLVDPGDADGFATSVTRFLSDRGLRDRLRAGARQASAHIRTWDIAVSEMATALDRLATAN